MNPIVTWITSWNASLTIGPVSMINMLSDIAKLRRKSMKNNPLVQGGQNFAAEFCRHLRISKQDEITTRRWSLGE